MSLSVEESQEIYRSHFATIPKRFDQSRPNVTFKVPGTKKSGYSHVYRGFASTELIETIHPKLNNMEILFQHAVNLFPNDDCLGQRFFNNTVQNGFDGFYTFQSFKKVLERRNNLASGLIKLVTTNPNFVRNEDTFKNGKPSFIVSLYCANRPEFILTDLACAAYSLPTTALYDSLGPESSKYILDITRSPVMILSKDKIKAMLKLKKKEDLGNLLVLVSIDSLDDNDSVLIQEAKNVGLQLVDYASLEELGKRNLLNIDFNVPTPDTIHHICFTSGSTGHPKGCVITHRNVVAFISAFQSFGRGLVSCYYKPSEETWNNKDDENQQFRYLSSLPLAHIYERTLTLVHLVSGVSIGFPTLPGSLSLVDDWRVLKPHSVSSVPRIWNRIEQTTRQVLQNYDFSGETIDTSGVDKFLTRTKVRNHFGLGKVRYITTGAAPLSHDTIRYINDHFAVGFIQGFGMSETTSAISTSDPFKADYDTSTVGGCFPSVEIRLKDVPHLGYSSTDIPRARGELLVRGPQVFSGYYRNDKVTEESFDEDGFFKTGDVAAIDEKGRLYIIDRVKNFFKLSQGEYITPERIENTYLANSPLLTQIYVHGDSLRDFLVGIIGVDPDGFKGWLKSIGTDADDYEELQKHFCDQNIKKSFVETINNHIINSGLQGFEKVHNIHIDLEPLQVADGVLTPTFKLKREVAKKKFQDIFTKLYGEGSLFRKPRL